MNHLLHIVAATQVAIDTRGRAHCWRKLAAESARMEPMLFETPDVGRRFQPPPVDARGRPAWILEADPGGRCGTPTPHVRLPRRASPVHAGEERSVRLTRLAEGHRDGVPGLLPPNGHRASMTMSVEVAQRRWGAPRAEVRREERSSSPASPSVGKRATQRARIRGRRRAPWRRGRPGRPSSSTRATSRRRPCDPDERLRGPRGPPGQ